MPKTKIVGAKPITPIVPIKPVEPIKPLMPINDRFSPLNFTDKTTGMPAMKKTRPTK